MFVRRGMSFFQKGFCQRQNKPIISQFNQKIVRLALPFIVGAAGLKLASCKIAYSPNLLGDKKQNHHNFLTTSYDENLRPLGMDTNQYQMQLLNQLVEKGKNCDETYRQEKAARLVETVAKAWLNEGDVEFNAKIIKGLEAIAAIRPGRKLLKELYALNPSLKINASTCEKDDGIYDSEKNYIAINIEKQIYEYVQTSKKIELKLDSSFYMTLAHELIHALHGSKSKETHKEMSESKKILNDEFTNLEEQITICGIKDGEFKYPICENVFRAAWGAPLRVNHKGFKLEKNEKLSVINLMDSYLTIKKHYTKTEQDLISLREELASAIDRTEGDSTFLHHAMNSNDKTLIRLLLEAGAKITPEIVSVYPSIIEFTPHLLDREDILLSYFSQKPEHFLSLSKSQQEDKTFVLKAVTMQPKLFALVNSTMKDDIDIVQAACQANARAETLKYASDRLKNDPNFISKLNERYLEYAGETLLDNRNFMLNMIKKSGRNIRYASERLRDDKTLGMEAVKQGSWLLNYLSPRLRDDFDTVWNAVKGGGWALSSAGPLMRDNETIVLEALKTDHTAINFASPRLQKEPKVLAAAESSKIRKLNLKHI